MCENECSFIGLCERHFEVGDQQSNCCCHQHPFQLLNQTKAEQIAQLEACLADFKAGEQAEKERLAGLRKW